MTDEQMPLEIPRLAYAQGEPVEYFSATHGMWMSDNVQIKGTRYDIKLCAGAGR